MVLASRRLDTPWVGVKVLEGPGRDPGPGNELVDVVSLQAYDAAHLVRGQLALVNKAVEGAQGHAEPGAGFRGSDPFDGVCRYRVILPGLAVAAVSQYFFAGFIHRPRSRAGVRGCRARAVQRRDCVVGSTFAHAAVKRWPAPTAAGIAKLAAR
jgi:hypothetical protein